MGLSIHVSRRSIFYGVPSFLQYEHIDISKLLTKVFLYRPHDGINETEFGKKLQFSLEILMSLCA
ncbi:uncharacterized protein PHALS_04046 [Plasmopara halstedii]|uniref:Uncharacterized protein n=1 Tax=Plasmopara halstedii TaxID=4781 RepID=A0A0N7L3T7_PLAHL|nr:uncharacterized protein PHALS_04046 [Plasmopara halstedii]CEG36787.1 hypothetical protein PHALS_04046 [Plasmopara halstedii]|eukprot:XP_024573156.1 hypothetical protein PHALS_04046 [Plasmopara halstedii]